MMQTLATGATRFGIALAATVAFCSIADESRAAEQPNVIVILTDDQGTIDAKCFGAKDLVTPGIDSLAQRGVRLTQFYAAAAVCSPSRAGLLTGRYPVRAGVPGNVSSQKGGAGMPSEQITMAETFKAAGYATAHVGKWHLGYTPQTMPGGQGFDFSFGHMGGCIDNFSKVLKSKTAESPHDLLHWTIGGSWAIMQGPWKLLGNPRDTGTTSSWTSPDSPGKLPAPPKLMLVNIEEDPSEKTDRSLQEPEGFQKLKAAQDDWAASVR